MIVLAAWGGLLCYGRQLREQQLLLWELAAALGEMESAIRWQRTPVPQILEKMQERGRCGDWFGRVLQKLRSDMPLQQCWDTTFADMEDTEIGEAVRRVQWNGDSERLIGALAHCREELETLHGRRAEEIRQKKRVTSGAVLCAAGLVIILLC